MTPRSILFLLIILPLSGCISELPGMEAGEHGHEAEDGAGHAMGDGMNHEAEGLHDGHAQTGMERPDFPPAKGTVPSADDAADFEQVSSLRIIGDEGFRPASGVRSGTGTPTDPYVIEHYYVAGDLFIQDTDACFIVRETYIGGQLSLNWNGICAHIHHNYINDLRVNENIRRDGYATGGLLEHNEIGFVGQLRHYDGEFRHNTVGPMPAAGPWDMVMETTPLLVGAPLIANVDGFNQGLIHHNTFHGSVDLDYHGHHHGTGFFAPHSHYHGDNETRKMPHDHTRRWTSVRFTDNLVIDDEGYGLRYEDRNHAGDDRLAASEQEDTLKLEHVHRSQIDLIGNEVRGAGIWVDVFNADDKLHTERNDGWLTVADNTIKLTQRDPGPFGLWGDPAAAHTAIRIVTVKEVDLRVTGNRLSFTGEQQEAGWMDILDPVAYPTALSVQGIHDGHLLISDNHATGFHTAILARSFDAAVWTVVDNDFGPVQVPLDADDTVPMPEG